MISIRRLAVFSLCIAALINSSSALSQTAPSKVLSGSASTNTERTRPQRPLVGLALGGGGARGAAEVGVLQVLVENGIPIDLIVGTSIGSVVGGLYASGMPLEEIEKVFADGSLMKAFMTVPLGVRIAATPLMITPRLIGERPYDGLYRGGKFRSFLDKTIAKNHCISKIENFHIPYAAVATSIVDGSSCRLETGDVGTVMQASCAVPALRKPVEINNNLYCDGGLICNLPAPHAKKMGADFVIAVNIDERVVPGPLKQYRKVGSVSKQAVRIDLADMDNQLEKSADFVIHPDTDGITLITTSTADAKRGIENGRKAAQEALPELKRRLAQLGIPVGK